MAGATAQGPASSDVLSEANGKAESIAPTSVEHSVLVSPIPLPAPATASATRKHEPEINPPLVIETKVAMAAATSIPTPPQVLRTSHLFPVQFRDEAIYGGATMVQHKIEEASRLASRGACYASRARLMDALRLLAEHLDAAEGSTEHRQALKAALKCLEEADDFSGSNQRGALDIARLAATHHTPLADTLPPNPTAAQALARYYAFAIHEFARAFPGRGDASMALYGLGKLHERLVGEAPPPGTQLVGDALVFQRAALTIDNRNWYAANELGVLLTQAGQLHEAADWLHSCAQLSQRPEAWHNVAVVSQKLGNARWADEAQRRSVVAGYQPSSQKCPAIQWVTPAALSMGQSSSWSRPEPRLGPQPLSVQPVSSPPPELAPVTRTDERSATSGGSATPPARSDSILSSAAQKRSIFGFPWTPWFQKTSANDSAANVQP